MDDREFRKIPSLKFLYEISEDGRIFRNVKSKKIIKQFLGRNGYWQVLGSINGKKFIKAAHSLVAECWLGEKPEGYEVDHIDRNKHNNHYTNLRYVTRSEQMKNRAYTEKRAAAVKANLEKAYQATRHPLKLVKGGEEKIFESMNEAARQLAAEFGKSARSIYCKFQRRRSHIYGYDAIYLNVETVRTRATAQETVQTYLVGTTDRWNDAKQSEEKERVKHTGERLTFNEKNL